MTELLVRGREPSDMDACVAMLHEVHAADGYPARWPSTPEHFIAHRQETMAWVAERSGEIVGHIALHAAAADPALAVAQRALELPASRLAVVARLIVSPKHRRLGIGTGLLAIAIGEAHAHDQHPILDVDTANGPAIGFYTALGWTIAGTMTVTFRQQPPLDCHVFVGPAPR